ncbi:hypothetical protein HNQ94_003308 [Salirhabdus euzebyi]|uniref:Uncharacterized protein n=1 Tax=Salirhabdus euzebyi TaxID=394506 RepID=A0A841Q892_9BACI|nr:hypothetical protein [Salirhabdus euzebyi]MBB6454819.1 hypothetical protein [Salirhabdus euzebyi]
MNANGMARGYMAKNMKVKEFTYHVINCLQRELGDQNRIVSFGLELVNENNVLLKVIEAKEKYFFVTSWEELRSHQQKSPYKLDRFIIMRLNDAGFTFNHFNSHYLYTVGQ